MYNEVGRHYRCHRPRVMGSTSPKGKGDERNGWSSAMQSAYKVSLSLSFQKSIGRDKKARASPRRQLTQIHEDKKFVENNMAFLGEMNAC